jgi:hypothetical protein
VKRLYLLATAFSKGAYERKFGDRVHGLFSRALIDALREQAIDGDGRMTAYDVARYVRLQLEPEAPKGLNLFPEPVVTEGFVLFENLKPRFTGVDVLSKDSAKTIEMFAGTDKTFSKPISPARCEGNVLHFDLPRGKTYMVLATNAAGKTVGRVSFTLENVPPKPIEL